LFHVLHIALAETFSRPANAAIAIMVALGAFLFAVWLPNFALICSVFGEGNVPFATKARLLVSLAGSIGTNFTMFSASYTVLSAILLGIYVAMVAHYLRRQRTAIRGAGNGIFAAGFLGAGSAVLGIGCAACGSFLLTGILSTVGASGALVLLPLGGGEFGVAAVLLLLVSVALVVKQIAAPLACGIHRSHA
jgi:hypothetical protein